MVVNVSPNARLGRATLNSLRYGQMYAGAGAGGGGKSKGSTYSRGKGKYPERVRREVSSGKGAGGGAGTGTSERGGFGFAAMDPDEAKAVLVEIYRKAHCPDKTEEDVSRLLAKFAGRERTLIQKVRGKYGVA
jgi:hypothetical protein